MKRFMAVFSSSAWFLFIILLPITSLPILSRLMGGTTVAPLSYIFLGILVLIWLLPKIIKQKSLPYQSLPLLLFILAALVSSLASVFIKIPTFRDISPWRSTLEAFITLGIGLSLYLLVGLYLSSKDKLLTFIKLINFSGLAIIFYSLIQAAFWYLTEDYPLFLWRFQQTISSSQLLYRQRVTGFSFEPSWLAHQLNMLYIPIWLGLTFKGVSAHKWNFLKLTFENILLILGSAVLLLSFSRIGWLSTIGVLAFLLFRKMIQISNKWVNNFRHKRSFPVSKWKVFWLYAAFWWAFILIVVGILLIAGLVLMRLDPRMEELFNIGLIADQGILPWAGKMIFAERLVYWIAGFKVYLQYPFLGTGLGNSGYFFPQTFNSFSYTLIEVTKILIHHTFIPNSKNLWIRLLAETGIIGFSIFIGWIYVHWKSARTIEFHKDSLIAGFGLIGQMFLVAFIIEGFSLDSFAMPYYWISFGLIVAIFRLANSNSISNK